MPPRISVVQCLRAQNAAHPSAVSRAFSSTPASPASTAAQRKHRDPYALAQAKARKAANLSRQEVLKQELAAALGDPVRGNTTPFIKSFDTALPPEPSSQSASTQTETTSSSATDASGPKTDAGNHLNFFLSKEDLDTGVKRSQWLAQPLPSGNAVKSSSSDTAATRDLSSSEPRRNEKSLENTISLDLSELLRDSLASSPGQRQANSFDEHNIDLTPEMREKKVKESHDTAQEALKRISSLSLGSSKDRTRVNIQRCIDVFGRHNTDNYLPPKPASTQTQEDAPEKFPRVGADTGSSEVQIAILTAKIRTLADGLELRGHPDKANKRNLRLLVHRRAKLLKYLRRKERGGPRWQNLIETLGLTDGTWKGEITL